MTTVARTARAIAGPPFVPIAVVLVLFGVALLMAPVAPGRVSTGLYQVVVWEGAEHVVIPAESLTCGRSGGTTTCTAPVGADRLTVELVYAGVVEPGGCAAEYGDRVVSLCASDGVLRARLQHGLVARARAYPGATGSAGG